MQRYISIDAPPLEVDDPILLAITFLIIQYPQLLFTTADAGLALLNKLYSGAKKAANGMKAVYANFKSDSESGEVWDTGYMGDPELLSPSIIPLQNIVDAGIKREWLPQKYIDPFSDEVFESKPYQDSITGYIFSSHTLSAIISRGQVTHKVSNQQLTLKDLKIKENDAQCIKIYYDLKRLAKYCGKMQKFLLSLSDQERQALVANVLNVTPHTFEGQSDEGVLDPELQCITLNLPEEKKVRFKSNVQINVFFKAKVKTTLNEVESAESSLKAQPNQ